MGLAVKGCLYVIRWLGAVIELTLKFDTVRLIIIILDIKCGIRCGNVELRWPLLNHGDHLESDDDYANEKMPHLSLTIKELSSVWAGLLTGCNAMAFRRLPAGMNFQSDPF